MNKQELVVKIAKNVSKCREVLTEASLYEQLAEECTELAQAALKKARKLRNENYTPLPEEKIDISLKEEYSDVTLVVATLGLKSDPAIMAKKSARWVKRNVKEANTDETD